MGEIFIGGGGVEGRDPQTLILRRANRHGLVAGATGTGKTVTLQVLAEAFSDAGVPVFMADVKGDLSGLAQAADPALFAPGGKLAGRVETIGMGDVAPRAFPVLFWDLFGEQGHPVRTTITEMGPLLLARLLELNDAQEGVLNIAFRLADEEGLALLDLKDLRALLAEIGARRQALSLSHGHVSAASIGAIQRRLLVLETEGAAAFFGEPALDLADLMGAEPDGRGRISVLAADRLMRSPRLYATFLLWLLSELFEELPEVGDPDKPKLAFFFDEAHLLFDSAPRPLLEKVEQVARLIRSKGVGVYFISQSPADVPDAVLGQLGNRVQHALRAYTPRDARALRVAAETFRPNPAFDTAEVLPLLGVGEALVSTLDAKGAPRPVERTLIRPPLSRMGPADPPIREAARAASPLAGKYETAIDRESASEILAARAAQAAAAAEAAAPEPDPFDAWNRGEAERRDDGGEFSRGRRWRPGGSAPKQAPKQAPKPATNSQPAGRSRQGDSVGDAFMKSFARSLGSRAGRTILRGVLGGLFKGR